MRHGALNHSRSVQINEKRIKSILCRGSHALCPNELTEGQVREMGDLPRRWSRFSMTYSGRLESSSGGSEPQLLFHFFNLDVQSNYVHYAHIYRHTNTHILSSPRRRCPEIFAALCNHALFFHTCSPITPQRLFWKPTQSDPVALTPHPDSIIHHAFACQVFPLPI